MNNKWHAIKTSTINKNIDYKNIDLLGKGCSIILHRSATLFSIDQFKLLRATLIKTKSQSSWDSYFKWFCLINIIDTYPHHNK